MAREWLRRTAAASSDGELGYAAGLLAARETAALEATRRQWRDAWDAVDRKRVRGWL